MGISKIILYRHSSILSAFGLALADVVQEVQEPSAETLGQEAMPRLQERVNHLIQNCTNELSAKQGFQTSDVTTEIYLNLRYEGTDCALMTLKPEDSWDFENTFVQLYKQEFGFALTDRKIIVDDIRVRGIGHTLGGDKALTPKHELDTLDIKDADPVALRDTVTSVYFESIGRDNNVPVYRLQNLPPGTRVTGPAIIIDATATIVVEPFCAAVVTSQHITITVGKGERKKITTELEPIQLSIFSHRFMSIAEQMGRSLQKTAISTNIKERLGKAFSFPFGILVAYKKITFIDFSCALFGAEGGLVANAPHIPVHLGALSHAVTYQLNYYKGNLKEGDVIMTNHPAAGGSHLPGKYLILI